MNLDEIARITSDHSLMLRIDGAADMETGTEKINMSLSRRRANYIKRQLIKRGIGASNLKVFWHGGVDEHQRNEVSVPRETGEKKGVTATAR